MFGVLEYRIQYGQCSPTSESKVLLCTLPGGGNAASSPKLRIAILDFDDILFVHGKRCSICRTPSGVGCEVGVRGMALFLVLGIAVVHECKISVLDALLYGHGVLLYQPGPQSTW